MAAAADYLQLVEARGHVSQTEKAKAYSPCAQVLARPAVRAHPLFRAMQVVPPEQGLEVLGAPIGSDRWCRRWLARNVVDTSKHFRAVQELARHAHPHAVQAAWLLLRYSAGTRCQHLLRMLRPALAH